MDAKTLLYLLGAVVAGLFALACACEKGKEVQAQRASVGEHSARDISFLAIVFLVASWYCVWEGSLHYALILRQ